MLTNVKPAYQFRNSSSIVRIVMIALSTHGDSYMDIPGMRQCLDEEVRNHLEELTLF
jgi:hypothetical protein